MSALARLAAAVACAVPLVVPALAVPAAAAEQPAFRMEDFSLNSVHVHDRVWTRVRVPDGPAPRDGWPVLYLFHGNGENHTTWTAPLAGDLHAALPDLPAVVVMPEVRGSWMTDNHGNPKAAWTRYLLEELVPHVDARYPVSRLRRDRTVAGASMGGMGALLLASQRPDQFGTAVSLSGALNHQEPVISTGVEVANANEGGYTGIFGPRDGHYATGHNPTRLTDNLRSTRTLVFAGDGTVDPSAAEADRLAVDQPVIDKVFLAALGVPLEVVSREHAEAFVAAAKADGVPVTYEVLPGAHEWPYLRRQLQRAAQLGLFGSGSAPSAWTYRTARQRGRAWAFDYRFDGRPPSLVTFSYTGGVLRGEGSGTVTVDGPGCRFTAPLPFERSCPVGVLPPPTGG